MRDTMKWIGRFIFFWIFAAAISGLFYCKKSNHDPDSPPVIEPVEISMEVETLYSTHTENCLAGSAGYNWAQRAPNGTVGIVFLNADNGTGSQLILKTILVDGSVQTEEVASGAGIENCVLSYDSLSVPCIFAVATNGKAQDLLHFIRGNNGVWQSEVVSHFANSGGEYVMELAIAAGPNDFLHLAVLQFGSTPENYLNANMNSNLFYITNKNGAWKQDLVRHFDSIYILLNVGYWYMRPLRRLSLAVDAAGNAHLAYGAIVRKGSDPYPSEMRYATNASGNWVVSTALPAPDNQSEAGYNPAIAINSQGKIVMACTFMGRVPAKSAANSELIYAELDGAHWNTTVLANMADGYYGYDGGNFTGAIPHLCFDKQDQPHILFCDIASSHVGDGSYLNVGQIRHLCYNGQNWEVSTLYRQASPKDYLHVNEIHAHCLMLHPDSNQFRIVAEEFIASGSVYQHNLLYLNFN